MKEDFLNLTHLIRSPKLDDDGIGNVTLLGYLKRNDINCTYTDLLVVDASDARYTDPADINDAVKVTVIVDRVTIVSEKRLSLEEAKGVADYMFNQLVEKDRDPDLDEKEDMSRKCEGELDFLIGGSPLASCGFRLDTPEAQALSSTTQYPCQLAWDTTVYNYGGAYRDDRAKNLYIASGFHKVDISLTVQSVDFAGIIDLSCVFNNAVTVGSIIIDVPVGGKAQGSITIPIENTYDVEKYLNFYFNTSGATGGDLTYQFHISANRIA